jgi:serine/threonine protein kinase
MYKNIDSWLNNFLFKTIDIAWELLENNGVYALYIEEKPQYPFIDKLKKYMLSKSGCKYEGIIYQIYKDERYVKRPYDVHTVYVWRKEASLLALRKLPASLTLSDAKHHRSDGVTLRDGVSGDQRSLCSLNKACAVGEQRVSLCFLYESLDSSHVIGYGYSSIVKRASLSRDEVALRDQGSPAPVVLSDTLYHRSDTIALRDQGSPVPLALKKVFLSKENLDKKKNELYINQTLNTNPKYAALKKHVVPFYDYEFCKNDSDIVALIMSFKYEPNSLYSYILEKIDKNSFTEKDKSFIFSKVVNLIKLFSSYGVYHKDLHLQNIAIGTEGVGERSSLNASRRRVFDSLMFFDWGRAVIGSKNPSDSGELRSLKSKGLEVSLIKKFKETYEADIKFMKFMKSINFDFDKAMDYLKRKGVYDEYIHSVDKEIRFFRTQTYKSEELIKEIEYMVRVWMFKKLLDDFVV